MYVYMYVYIGTYKLYNYYTNNTNIKLKAANIEFFIGIYNIWQYVEKLVHNIKLHKTANCR